MHASKSGEGAGLIYGIVTFPCDDHLPPVEYKLGARSILSLVVCVGKTREKRQSKHNKTQIASLLAVATVFLLAYGLYSRADNR